MSSSSSGGVLRRVWNVRQMDLKGRFTRFLTRSTVCLGLGPVMVADLEGMV